jgi:hypothetical protein
VRRNRRRYVAAVLFRRPALDGIAGGTVTVAYRRWPRPRVVVGTRLRTAVGVVEVTDVTVVDEGALTEADAHAAGLRSLAELRRLLAGRDGEVHRVGLRLAGADPRVALREAIPSGAELDALVGRVRAIDRRAQAPWAVTTLRLIADREGVRAPDLAASLGRETLPFKRDVRRLKELGLTESLSVGYRLSPRGRAVLDAIDAHPDMPPAQP